MEAGVGEHRPSSQCDMSWSGTHSDSSGWWRLPQPSVQPPEQQSWRGDSIRKQIKERQWAVGGGGGLSESEPDTGGRIYAARQLLKPHLIGVGWADGRGRL